MVGRHVFRAFGYFERRLDVTARARRTSPPRKGSRLEDLRSPHRPRGEAVLKCSAVTPAVTWVQHGSLFGARTRHALRWLYTVCVVITRADPW